MRAPNILQRVIGNKKLLPQVSQNLFGSSIEGLYNQAFFKELVQLERKRSERSKDTFFLVLLNIKALIIKTGFDKQIVEKIVGVIATSSRESDVRGWYEDPIELGIVYTEVTKEAFENIMAKLKDNLIQSLSEQLACLIQITSTVFPEEDGKVWTHKSNEGEIAHLYSSPKFQEKKVQLGLKRTIDFVSSSLGIIVLLPLFLLIAAIIKATSEGPIFFRQERIGQNGKRFLLLKFRSMHINSNDSIHQEYVKKLINGQVAGSAGDETTCYKIKNDPRVTAVGRFIRKTSIDELPQLLNVLKGEMSLVGPRPPIAYEVEEYDIWHRKRILEMKPGITGLWQVVGRSKTTFDGMVRMDIVYIRNWSLWLDLKLIMKTPAVLLSGKGAY